MTRALVTGGAGFIGSHLAAALLREGYEVRILDDLSTGFERNLEAAREAEFIRASVADLDAVRRAVAGCDYVFHEAALSSVPRSVRNPVASNEVNVGGTLNVLIASRDADVKRLIYAGSSSAYGDSDVLPKAESMPSMPRSPYAVSKLAGENYVSTFASVYGMETLTLRYFNVFGPRQDPNGAYAAVIPLFTQALLEGKQATIHGDGEQSRDFTYVDNVVHGNLLALKAPRLDGAVVNVALGRRISLNDLYRELAELIGSDVQPIHGRPRPGDVRHSQADITRARELLGFEAPVSLQEGLRRTVEWYRAEREADGRRAVG